MVKAQGNAVTVQDETVIEDVNGMVAKLRGLDAAAEFLPRTHVAAKVGEILGANVGGLDNLTAALKPLKRAKKNGNGDEGAEVAE